MNHRNLNTYQVLVVYTFSLSTLHEFADETQTDIQNYLTCLIFGENKIYISVYLQHKINCCGSFCRL